MKKNISTKLKKCKGISYLVCGKKKKLLNGSGHRHFLQRRYIADIIVTASSLFSKTSIWPHISDLNTVRIEHFSG